jgi:hypothetical protein
MLIPFQVDDRFRLKKVKTYNELPVFWALETKWILRVYPSIIPSPKLVRETPEFAVLGPN